MLHSVTAMKVGLIIEQLEQKRPNELTRCHPSVPQHMIPPLVRQVVRRKTTTALRQPARQRSCRVPVTTREKADHKHYARAPMEPVGHYVLPVGKGVAVIHSPALLHPCMYPVPTPTSAPCRVLSQRQPIKAAGKWDNGISAGHCFLCHVYLRSGDDWIEHFGEQHGREEKRPADIGGGPGADAGGGPGADIGGDPGSADIGGDCRPADVGGGPRPADVGGDCRPADVGGDPGSTDVGGDCRPADVGGDCRPADVGGGPRPADVGGDCRPADVGGDCRPADIWGGPRQADVGGDCRPADVGGGPRPADVGGDCRPADVGGDCRPADVWGGPRQADVGGDSRPADVGGGPRPADVWGGSAQLGGGPVPTVCFRTKPNEYKTVEQIVKIFGSGNISETESLCAICWRCIFI